MRRLFALALCLACLLTGCGGEVPPASSSGESSQSQPPAQSLSQPSPFALAAYPAYSFHPALAENKANLTLAPLLYEGLFAANGSFEAEGVLCQSWTASEDKLTWTFTLRGGVTFSDGTPLTGEIVAQALNTARGEGSRYQQRLRDVADVAGEGGQVTITLSQPNGALPLLLDIPISLGEGERPLGTGPYVLEEGGLSLRANGSWWRGEPLPCQEIPLVAMSRSDDLLAAFEAGDVTLLDVDLMGTNALGYSGSYEVWDYATGDFIYLAFNTRSGLCQSPAVRRALAKGVDRETIAEVVYAGHAVPASVPAHPASGLAEGEAGLAYDPEGLVPALEAEGVLGRKLVMLVNSENSAKVSAAEQIAYQLTAAGMEVELKKLPWEEFVAALEQGAFDLYLGETVLTADFDLTALLSSGGTLNYGGWTDSTTDSLLTAFRASDLTGRKGSPTLYRHLAEQAPLVPVCFKHGSVLTQWGRLSGLEPVQNDVFYHLSGWTIASETKQEESVPGGAPDGAAP